MGLTHAWQRPIELPAAEFAAAVKETQLVLGHAAVPLAGFGCHGQPIFLNDTVVFNGLGNAGCEPFEIHQVEFDQRGRSEKNSYCKTEGLPYDLAVKAALIVFKKHLGESIKVMSDQSDDAWDLARTLVIKTAGFGANFKLDPRS